MFRDILWSLVINFSYIFVTILDAMNMLYNTKTLPIYNGMIIECSNNKNVL